MKVEDIKIGHTYSNGSKRTRTVIGFDGLYVYYKTPSSKKSTTGEHILSFLNLAKKDITKE